MKKLVLFAASAAVLFMAGMGTVARGEDVLVYTNITLTVTETPFTNQTVEITETTTTLTCAAFPGEGVFSRLLAAGGRYGTEVLTSGTAHNAVAVELEGRSGHLRVVYRIQQVNGVSNCTASVYGELATGATGKLFDLPALTSAQSGFFNLDTGQSIIDATASTRMTSTAVIPLESDMSMLIYGSAGSTNSTVGYRVEYIDVRQ